jgi:hypothetical protein
MSELSSNLTTHSKDYSPKPRHINQSFLQESAATEFHVNVRETGRPMGIRIKELQNN